MCIAANLMIDSAAKLARIDKNFSMREKGQQFCALSKEWKQYET